MEKKKKKGRRRRRRRRNKKKPNLRYGISHSVWNSKVYMNFHAIGWLVACPPNLDFC